MKDLQLDNYNFIETNYYKKTEYDTKCELDHEDKDIKVQIPNCKMYALLTHLTILVTYLVIESERN